MDAPNDYRDVTINGTNTMPTTELSNMHKTQDSKRSTEDQMGALKYHGKCDPTQMNQKSQLFMLLLLTC